MKKIFFLVMLSVLSLSAMAQYAEDTENGIVSLAGKEGFTLKSKKGDFVFKPYLLVQASANVNWYDDEGLDKAEIRDRRQLRPRGKNVGAAEGNPAAVRRGWERKLQGRRD